MFVYVIYYSSNQIHKKHCFYESWLFLHLLTPFILVAYISFVAFFQQRTHLWNSNLPCKTLVLSVLRLLLITVCCSVVLLISVLTFHEFHKPLHYARRIQHTHICRENAVYLRT